ncbi:hypothetical protein BFL28_10310 [Sphingomonas turrisvirgatae]|uniref:Uncharacterized protein n=1 Tax=Sphingomonas turrisvirgatae TaxID=1888892 RepID=A0A1E3M067_9SPHN|nr:hypothetical protein BFL28_10310 [Sphingomonas turrisvirgatae]
MLPLASRRHVIEQPFIISYAVAVALTTIAATTAVGALRCSLERQARAAQALAPRVRPKWSWRR